MWRVTIKPGSFKSRRFLRKKKSHLNPWKDLNAEFDFCCLHCLELSQIRRKENNLKFAAHKRTPSEVKERNRISTVFTAKAGYQTRNAWKLAKIRQSKLYERNYNNNSACDPLCPCVPKTRSNLWITAQSRVNNILSKVTQRRQVISAFPKIYCTLLCSECITRF